jgi:cell wall assembly regulator SMI1
MSLSTPNANKGARRYEALPCPLYLPRHAGADRQFPRPAHTATKELLDGMIGTDFEDPKWWWRRGWVPFLWNGDGDHLCLDVVAEDGGTPSQVVAFWHDWEDHSIEFAILDEWLETLVESMEDGTLKLA